ncbi:Hypothetical protein NTJ_05533 [Nesidiocoris tenuis]|nr:Hypothetical protein NTJ_05533 [Nesidiocoris tenuis]
MDHQRFFTAATAAKATLEEINSLAYKAKPHKATSLDFVSSGTIDDPSVRGRVPDKRTGFPQELTTPIGLR